MKLALDENLPPSLARAIHALLAPDSGEAISIPERFGAGFADRDWIATLREQRGWAVLTADHKLRTRPHERLVLMQSGLIVLVLAHGWSQDPFWPKATGIIRWLPVMLDAWRTTTPPALLEVPHRWSPAKLRPFKAT
jgi:hypothetical protein